MYVDRTDHGDSYGDYSASPKYKHRTCITGKRGPAGDSSVITWNTTVATAAEEQGAKHKVSGGIPAGAITLATVGPFTIRGYCTTGDGVVFADTDVVSGQDGSSFAWDDTVDAGNFNSGNDEEASNSASSDDPSDPDFANENSTGDFSVSTADQTTAFTGFANNGVFLNGADGPACSFTGYLVLEK